MAGADELQAASKENNKRFEKISPTMANIIALSQLESEELCQLKMKKLYEVAAYLSLSLPPDIEPKATKKLKDKRDLEYAKDSLIELIMAANLEKAALHNTAKDLYRTRTADDGKWAHPFFWAGFVLTGVAKGI